MKRSEVRDLMEGIRLSQIDEWVEKEHISMRSLQPCDETASDNAHIVVQTAIFGPFGNQSIGYDPHLNKYMWCLINNRYYPANQIIGVMYSERSSFISKVNVSTEALETLNLCPVTNVYFQQEYGLEVDGLLLAPSAVKETFRCSMCGERHLKSNAQEVVVNGEVHRYCNSCWRKQELMSCCECGEYHTKEDMKMIEGKVMCSRCFNAKYVKDEINGSYIRRENSAVLHQYSGDSKVMSLDYLKEHYPAAVRCDYSGEYFLSSSDLITVEGKKYSRKAIRDAVGGYHSYNRSNYSYKLAAPYENTNLYFGTEIECQGDSVNALYVQQNFGDLFHCERDGSIGEGFEIISQPMTYKFMRNNYSRISTMLTTLAQKGMKSHDTTVCGLHVHISREAFKDEKAIDRFNAMVTVFKKNMEVLARRKDGHYYRYGVIDGVITRQKIKEKASMGHGVSVNLANRTTVEIRVFRGTLNPKTYMATIELVKNLVEAANDDRDVVVFGELLNGQYLPDYVSQRVLKYHQTIDTKAQADFSHYDGEMTQAENDEIDELLAEAAAASMESTGEAACV